MFCLLALLHAGPAYGVDTDSVGLDFRAPARVVIPASTAGPTPERFSVLGPFRLAGAVAGVRTYEAANPVRPRALFFERQPLEMELFKGERRLAYDADPAHRGMAGAWEVNGSSVMVRIRPETGHPVSGQYTMVYPPATEREESLRFRGGDAVAWSIRSAQVDDVSRHGLLLPTGSEAVWSVQLPERARLRFEAGVLPPEISEGDDSDGATVDVLVDDQVVHSVHVALGAFRAFTLDLGLTGRHTVAFRTHDANPHQDHVFVASPTVYAQGAKPKKVVLAFVDTLRRDHLPTYGYTRDTAPKLDRWAKDAVVFEDARTLAPWTLPSTRALWTGRQPEVWSSSLSLQEALRIRGWATGAFVGNVYLSSNFGMDRGWGEHGCLNWPGAAYETFRARDFLRRHADEDAMVMVHFMDMHLPYKEPAKYRNLWAKADPRGLEPMFNRMILMRVAMHQRELLRPYLIDRYDQNLRYIDDELSAFLNELDDDTTVVLFSDHGEEFFDHGEVEHGHSLYDELLRVPLIIKSPGLAARRVPAAVSLMDVAPTLAELLGLPADALGGATEGRSLAGIAKGIADDSFEHRALAVGRVLYGGVQWGSVRDQTKYLSTAGREQLFDLAADPGERKDLAPSGGDVRGGRQALAEALNRGIVQALRISPTGRANKEILVDVHVPGGVAHAWVGDDPTSVTLAEIRGIDGEFVHLAFESRLKEHREVFIVPTRPADEVVYEVGVKLVGRLPGFERLKGAPHDGSGSALSRTRSGATALGVTWAVVPLPAGDAIIGADGELSGALEALGYSQPIRTDTLGDEEEPEEAPDEGRP